MKIKLFIYILIVSNILLIFTVFVQSSKFGKNKNLTSTTTISSSKENISSNIFLGLSIENEGVSIDKEIFLIDTNLVRHRFSDIISRDGQKKVFIRYSFKDCSNCIDKVDKIIKSFPLEHRNKVVFLSDNETTRTFIVKEMAKNSGINSYTFDPDDDRNITGKFLGIPLEGKGMPFCFTINAQFETDNFFIPDVDNEQIIREYFNIIFNKI